MSGRDQERGCPRLRGEPLVRQALRQAGRAGTLVGPKGRPCSKPKMDEGARRLLEADLEGRLVATLPQTREVLERVAGVRVSDSTVVRMLKRLGFSRKMIAGSSGARRVLEDRLAGTGRLGASTEGASCSRGRVRGEHLALPTARLLV
jgi:transposase